MLRRVGVENEVTTRRHVEARAPAADTWTYRTAGRSARAEAIVEGVHWVWTRARPIVERLINGRSRGHTPAPDGKRSPMALGRASVAGAFRRDLVRLRRLVRRSVLEPYTRWRQRKIAVASLRALDDRLLADIGLLRGDIELAIDGGLPPRGDRLAPRARQHPPREEPRYELPLAA